MLLLLMLPIVNKSNFKCNYVVRCTIRKEGGQYVINGRKWWTTGAADPRCKICILMGKVEGSGNDIHLQQVRSFHLFNRDSR